MCYGPQYKRFRSRLRYWMASEIWADLIPSSPAKSAMVRPTFKIRVYARTLRPNLSMAISRSLWLASSMEQNLLMCRLVIWALQWIFNPRNRSDWIFRALLIRSFNILEDSPESLASSPYTFWNPSSPDESYIRNGMVGGPKGSLNHEGTIAGRSSTTMWISVMSITNFYAL